MESRHWGVRLTFLSAAGSPGNNAVAVMTWIISVFSKEAVR